jgi:hypothetical protein
MGTPFETGFDKLSLPQDERKPTTELILRREVPELVEGPSVSKD